MPDMTTMKTWREWQICADFSQIQQKQQVARTGVFVQKKVYIKIEKKKILAFAWLEAILS